MHTNATQLPYRQTNAFSRIAVDYAEQSESLQPFYTHAPTFAGIQKAIDARKNFTTDRKVLVEELSKQYAVVTSTDAVQQNIAALANENTFTVTTAHQNNIFTGPLYFIYKILHAVKLAAYLKEKMPENNFVPVYYIGSEDADLDELNHIKLDGKKMVWATNQTGAVGRMKIDKELLQLINEMDGQLSVLPYGKETIALLKSCYQNSDNIQTATFKIVNELFGRFGLLVLLPDNRELKRLATSVFKDELLHQHASGIVEKTSAKLGELYKVQAYPREINLFYLKDAIRERIETDGDGYKVVNTSFVFTRDEMMKELEQNPERFSPNVILRGIYQETILPNIAFIGGGGELAYWLELKDLFVHYKVPYPVQLLRNSFLLLENKWTVTIQKLGFSINDFFSGEQELINRYVVRETDKKLSLNSTLTAAENLYETIKQQAATVDVTLAKHVDALKTKTVYRLQQLEKKIMRAEKRKFSDQQRQIHAIRQQLFPENGLQERVDNIFYFYAKWGSAVIDSIYQHSTALETQFVIIEISE
jgi:bacillithiol biosynthesis cysteine-adding enzyme BshC